MPLPESCRGIPLVSAGIFFIIEETGHSHGRSQIIFTMLDLSSSENHCSEHGQKQNHTRKFKACREAADEEDSDLEELESEDVGTEGRLTAPSKM
mgnify:CR=1 FL=1